MLKLFLSNLSQGPIKVSLFQGQSFSQLDIYVVNHFLVIDVVFTKIPITHKMLHIVVEPFRRLRNSRHLTTGVSLHFVRTSSPGSAGSTPWGSSGSHGTNEKELARKENG